MGDRPDGIIDGIKIIKGIDFGDNNPKHDLPASSHLSNSYIKYNHDGTVITMRVVSHSDGTPVVDVNIRNSTRTGGVKTQKYILFRRMCNEENKCML